MHAPAPPACAIPQEHPASDPRSASEEKEPREGEQLERGYLSESDTRDDEDGSGAPDTDIESIFRMDSEDEGIENEDCCIASDDE